MKGDADVIKKLNLILTNELTSINQYFLHARMYQSEGYGKLGKKTYEESIEEMKHADRIIKRILLIEGFPNLQNLNKLQIGESVPERLQGDDRFRRRGPQRRQEAELGRQLALGDLLERDIHVLHLLVVRLDQRALPGVQLAHPARNHIDEKRDVADALFGQIEICDIHGFGIP